MLTNLPPSVNISQQPDVKEFFDSYFVSKVSFPANEIDATIAFLVKRGFDTISASSTAIVLLNQARNEHVPVFQLLDRLKALTDTQLSQVVAQVLNSYREKTSYLGYRVATAINSYETRNILI